MSFPEGKCKGSRCFRSRDRLSGLLDRKDKVNAAAIAKEMLEGVDPAKWICVQVDEVEVALKGDVILLVMVQSELGISASHMVKAFEKACGGAA